MEQYRLKAQRRRRRRRSYQTGFRTDRGDLLTRERQARMKSASVCPFSNSRLSPLQCYLFAYFSVWRNSKSFLAFALVCLSNMYLYELRNMWQILFHVAVGGFMTLQIRLRQPQGKAPDYNVWRQPPKCSKKEKKKPQVWSSVVAVLFCLLAQRDGAAVLSLDLEEFQPVSDYFWKFFSSFYYL